MEKEISQAVIRRMPRYYRYLGELLEEGVERISSNDLSHRMMVTASQIRQDLNNFGGFGQQGYGYNVKYLYDEIGKILGLNETHNIIMIGAGNLGQAITNYVKFPVQKTAVGSQERILEFDLASELHHGMMVSNLAYALAEEMGLPHEQCYELAIAGMLHDIGKLKLTSYINGQEQDPLVIEELKYVRMHSTLGYEELKGQGYSDFVLESILYHHENYDGSGYPANKAGEDIPIGARILRVCDVYAALISDRPYRKAFDISAVMELMIDEVKNFDMQVFLAFQRVVHNGDGQSFRK